MRDILKQSAKASQLELEPDLLRQSGLPRLTATRDRLKVKMQLTPCGLRPLAFSGMLWPSY